MFMTCPQLEVFEYAKAAGDSYDAVTALSGLTLSEHRQRMRTHFLAAVGIAYSRTSADRLNFHLVGSGGDDDDCIQNFCFTIDFGLFCCPFTVACCKCHCGLLIVDLYVSFLASFIIIIINRRNCVAMSG